MEIIRKNKAEYSPFIGMVFIFNLILGTGALAMPKAFSMAGWGVGLIILIAVSFLSYMTSTFVVEALACSNALLKIKAFKKNDEITTDSNSPLPNDLTRREELDEDSALLPTVPLSEEGDLFEIAEVIEMGTMTQLFFNKTGCFLFYICICLYLFGDLAIYTVAVPKTLRDVTCTFYPNTSFNQTTLHPPTTSPIIPSSSQDLKNFSPNISDLCPLLLPSHPCWVSINLTRSDVYRIYVVLFVFFLGGFVYTNISKTKYLQLLTSLLRWIAFFTMVILTIKKLASGKGNGNPPIASFDNLSSLFGVCVYSFMCHHSLPQMITPITNKKHVYSMFAFNNFLVLLFYLLLSFTGIFCFHDLYDLYTLNFQPPKCPYASADFISTFSFIEYFLALFPVFTLSTSFPIIGITLRNNLKHILGLKKFKNTRKSFFLSFLDKFIVPTVVLSIPLLISMVTENVQLLVSITGSYPGALIQYVVPTFLLYLSRKKVSQLHLSHPDHKMRSPFHHNFWIFLILLWSLICIIIVTFNIIATNLPHIKLL